MNLKRLWGQPSLSIDIQERTRYRKRWTQEILGMMIMIITAAALLISVGVLVGIFSFQETLPIYVLLGLILPGWWIARSSAWRWASFLPVVLCFLLGVYGSYTSGFSSNLVLFYATSAFLAGILYGPRVKLPVILLSMLSITFFGIRLEGKFIPEMLAPLITVFFGLTGISVLQWYIDAHLWRLLAEQKKSNQLLQAEIAHRQQLEIAQREQAGQLQRLAENINDFVAEIDVLGSMRYVSPSHQTGLGYNPAALLGTSAFDLIHPEDQPACRAAMANAFQSGQPTRQQARCRHADGHFICIEMSGVPLFSENGQPAGIALTSRDITLQHNAETALRFSEEKFSKAFQLSPDSININRLSDGVYLDINPGFTKLMGYTREEVIGKSSLTLSIWADPADRVRLVQGLRETGEVDHLEAHFRRKNDEIGLGLMSARILEIGGENCILSVTRDITESKLAEMALRLAHSELEEAYEATLQGWARALELHEQDTATHSRRVIQFTVQIARAMGMEEQDLILLERGALLHDIGKLGVPEEILLKPGTLDDREWQIMHQHPDFAYYFLKDIHYLRQAIEIPYGHHEHWDGSGYPRGLCGKEIPLAARIFTVVDVFDALTSDRPYRPAWSLQQACEYLIAEKGRLFDPQIVDLFLKILQFPG